MEKFIPEVRYIEVEFDPFAGPAIQRTAPTTEAQREVWSASQMSRDANCAYNESVTLCLEGPLDRGHLQRAISFLVQRHEGLRSTISADGLSLVVLEQMEIPMAFTDLGALGTVEMQARLAAIGEEDMERPFDLLNGPLFRTHLIRTGERQHQLRLTGHHLFLDGWSMGIVMGDISRAYTAYATGQQPQLPPAYRFSDFAQAQLEFMASKEFAEVERYWLGLFEGPEPRLDLPTDRPRPQRKTYAGSRIDMEMDPVLTQHLRTLSTRTGTSLVTTLLTCFELLVHKLTGDNDLCIGLPAAGQNDFGMKELVGHCVNLLALRSSIDRDQSFIAHLKERRSAVLDASDNQKYTYGTLVRKLNVPREPGRIPLCPVVFNLDMDMDSEVDFHGLEHHVISNPRKYENFELYLNVTGKGNSLVLEWSYNTDLFDAATINHMVQDFHLLLKGIVADPARSIRELVLPLTIGPQLPPAEWSGTFNNYPKVDIPTLFEQVAGQYPDNVAVELEDEKITYAELLKQSATLAHALVGMGVRPGDPVGVCMDRSIGTQTAMLAILRAGGCYVPLDPYYPAERLAFMLNDSRVKILLTQRQLLPHLPPHDARDVFPEEIVEAAPSALPRLTPEAAAYIIYTSGSTGTPKGVVVPHRGIVRLVRDQNYVDLDSSLVILQISNLCFDGSVFEIWGALLNGGKLVVQPQPKPTLQQIVDNIVLHKVNTACFTSGLFNLMVDEHVEDLHCLKYLLAGGDALSVRHVKRALQVLGPGVVINGYGPTENTDYTTCHTINNEAELEVRVPIGRPISNTTVHILDPGMNPVPIGIKGELYTGGDGIALGYWHRPELTASRFIDDPFRTVPGAKLYRTGDHARWRPDGTVDFLGRIDGQVKVRGFRVELGEIENAIGSIREVKDRVVITHPDVSGEKQLVAYLVPKDPDAKHHEDLATTVRDQLRKVLPEYMVPLAFVVLPKLPLTSNGKVDRRALPAPELDLSTRAAYEEPTGEVEKTLAGIWGSLLHVERVGRQDNFFNLGGHSLLGIQMLAGVRSAFHVELSLLAVFETPTLCGLAEVISRAAQSTRPSITPASRAGDLDASFGQRRMWMSSQFGQDAYDMSQVYRITGELDTEKLEHALNALVERHEPLRTTFDATPSGKLVQHIHPHVARALRVETVASYPEALSRCQQESQRSWDLGTGPVFDPLLLRINTNDHVLLLRMHHIVGDEWSIGVLINDLSAFYKGQALAPLQFSYADFADWQRAQLNGQVEERELDYWRDQLAGAPPLLELPTDRPRPPAYTTNGALRKRVLPAGLWHGIEAIGKQHQATPFMTLLAAFQVLLHRLSGVSDISVGTPIANREQPGTEALVGFFINTLVLRTDLSGSPGFTELLARVRRVALGAFAHQDIPFERVVEAVIPGRNPAHTPLFQVSFVHQPKEALSTIPGLEFTPVELATSTAKFDLTLFTVPGPDGLGCTLEYNTDLFDAATVDRMLEQLQHLLEGIVASPERSIDELPMPAEDAAKPLPADWNGTPSSYPRESSMGQLFREVVAAGPERIAVEMGGTRLSYRALEQRMLVIAGALERQGVAPGDLVGLCCDRCPDMVAAMLAILWRGAAFVPFDPSYPKERLDYMFKDSGVKVLLAQRHLTGLLPANEVKIVLLDRIGAETLSTHGPLGTALSPAYIMYTSGSTGQPKGVVVPHRAIVRLVKGQDFLPFGPDLVFLQLSNISFDASTLEIWGALLNGAKLVLQPQQKPTFQEIISTIRQHRVTTVWFTAGLFNLLVDEHLEDLRGLQHILTGGDVLSVPHMKRALHVLGPGVLINGYGPTENTTFTCCHPINGEDSLQGRVPIGRPLHNTFVHILDEDMKPVGIGQPGELYAGGDGVALGYWQKPELTAERFVDDPFSTEPGAKLYRTGDRAAWLPNGSIDFLGRTDGQVKVRGFRIELGEVERSIALLGGVKDNVVVVREDLPGEKQLVAYLVPGEATLAKADPQAQEALIDQVRDQLRDRLPNYMMPTAFVLLPQLPLTANGKVDKRQLPQPVQRSQTMEMKYVAPRNAKEKRLAAIWSEVLRVEHVGIHDNFFDLGGQSMAAIQILGRVEEQFGKKLSLSALFQAPTISAFAKLLQDEPEQVPLTNLVALQPAGDRIPFFCVHGDEANHHLTRYLGGDQPYYAFFHQGEDGAPFAYKTVEDIAAHYVKEMLSVRPEGPYLLGGYSFGGIVAYEMAFQLSKAGHEVPLLAMFDMISPALFTESLGDDDKFYSPLKRRVMQWLVDRELRKGKIRSPRLRHFHIIANYHRAIEAYQPPTYQGPVTIFKAVSTPGPDDLGWGALVKGKLDVHVIPGDHYSMIKDPEVQQLVQELSACMDRALHKHAVEAV
jgi:amino acid adenylation domain-containing protein